MRYHELQSVIDDLYGPALILDRVVSPAQRLRIGKSLTLIFILVLCVAIGAFYLDVTENPLMAYLVLTPLQWYGVLHIILALRLIVFSIESFWRSHAFRDLQTILPEYGEEPPVSASYEVAHIISETTSFDTTKGFALSSYGSQVLLRAEVDFRKMRTFFEGARIPPSLSAPIDIPDDHGHVSLSSYARSILQNDPAFMQFLSSEELGEREVVGAAEWVERMSETERRKRRWWSRDSLGRIPGLGKEWAYGEIYTLQKYGHDVREDPIYRSLPNNAWRDNTALTKIETILARSRQANVLIVGPDESGLLETVAHLAQKIDSGEILPPIEHKHVMVLDLDAVIGAHTARNTVEIELTKIFNQAVAAGNIVVALSNFSSVVQSARSAGVDILEFLTPYLAGNAIQFVVTSEQGEFHRVLEPDSRIASYFERVLVEELGEDMVVRILGERAIMLERSSPIAFTYPSLQEIARASDRYIVGGVMPDKAIDMLNEALPFAHARGADAVTRKLIRELVSQKTGIPVGEATENEKEKLLRLEELLHERVIGQHGAISAIANAMRRARAGIRNPGKPIGSFLFLGPTGVGKTETTKALAALFFGKEDSIIRFDMSEFRTDDALERLIGHFERGKPGVLAAKLREKPYGVVLLDEFEKTTMNVHDLFLQILDEGKFSDAMGKTVNARNTIIIATSNAGADLIWEYAKQGINVAEKDHELVDAIVKRGIFKPELLNRFDGIIVFHPLQDDHLQKIATMMLQKLAKRLQEDKGIELVITPELLGAVIKAGFDPQFGARPMARAIADKVEQTIARKMLSDELKAGMRISLTEADLAM